MNNFAQGKDVKDAATQKTTAQNFLNQSNYLLFSTTDVNDLTKALKRYDLGPYMEPFYVTSTITMSQRIIDKARIPEEQKNILRSAFSILLGMVTAVDKAIEGGADSENAIPAAELPY